MGGWPLGALGVVGITGGQGSSGCSVVVRRSDYQRNACSRVLGVLGVGVLGVLGIANGVVGVVVTIWSVRVVLLLDAHGPMPQPSL